jgi:hypothetical protein
LGGVEYFVPELARRALESSEPQPWGHGEVTPELARRLFDLAEALGHWVDLDEPGIGYQPFDPFPIPLQYLEGLDRERAYALTHPGKPKRKRS